MTLCPNCGKRTEGAFCIWCGTPAPTRSTQDDAPVKTGINPSSPKTTSSPVKPVKAGIPWSKILLAELIVSAGLLVLFGIIYWAVNSSNHSTQHGPSSLSIPVKVGKLPTDQSEFTSTVRRIDPPHEAPASQIAKILHQAQGLSVSCGDDVDSQICKFFVNSLRVALRPKHVSVALYYLPETLVQSFYIPPGWFPLYNDVRLRLIEAETGPQGPVQLYVGGFCFDPHSQDEFSGFRLPTWVQTEGGGDTGPLEVDKAAAASRLAQEFASYWTDNVIRLGSVQASNTEPQSAGSSQGPKQSLSPPETAVTGDQSAPNDVASTRRAAEQGDADAQSNLGFMFEKGRGVPQDYAQAVYWYCKAAEQGNAVAQNNLGFLYCKGLGVPQDYPQAVSWFRKAAEQGNARAQDNLGFLYWKGLGVTQDYAQAVYWCRNAAEQGYAHAQSGLGVMFEKGLGVTQDYAQAVYWCRKAAEQGDAEAQARLGNLYSSGYGVPQDYAEAYFWLGLAASARVEGVKHEDVDKSRDGAASHLTPAELSQVQERVRKWFEEHPTKVE